MNKHIWDNIKCVANILPNALFKPVYYKVSKNKYRRGNITSFQHQCTFSKSKMIKVGVVLEKHRISCFLDFQTCPSRQRKVNSAFSPATKHLSPYCNSAPNFQFTMLSARQTCTRSCTSAAAGSWCGPAPAAWPAAAAAPADCSRSRACWLSAPGPPGSSP